jgi:hypothetical protein
MYNQVDAPGGGTNSAKHVRQEKKMHERTIAQELYDSIKDGDLEHAQIIMEQGLTTALIDSAPDTPGGSILTKALTLCAKEGHKQLLEAYLAQGGNPDLSSLNQGYTLLHEAILAGQPEVCEFLLRHYARTDLCNSHGLNARDLAEGCVARSLGNISIPLERYEMCLDAVNRSYHMRVKVDVDNASVGVRHWGKETRSGVGPPRIYRVMP